MSGLEGKAAVVTGSALGIGRATARRLAEEGAKVLIVDVQEEAANENAEFIRSAGGKAAVFIADVGVHDNIRAMVAECVSVWGRLDVLVNNAYSGGPESHGSAVTITEEAWDRGMAVLVKSMFLGAKYAVPEMQKAGGGSIVNLSSVHGLLMAPESLIYEAGKSAVIGVTKQMAIDFGQYGIRVNAICPGHIVTEKTVPRWNENPTGLDFFVNQYPVGRVGKPVDIANAITFLCSDEASFITGHALVVDGGLSIQLQENFGVRQAHYLQANPDTRMPY